MSHKDNKKSEITAMEAAAKYLSGRMRTVLEVKNHLSTKGYKADEIDETVNDLIGLRYLDDYQYALRYYEYNREKHRGSLRAARELAEKGVDPETVRYAREDFLYSNKVDEYEDALNVALSEISLKPAGTSYDEKLSAKIARKLDGKGFSRGDIFRVLDELRRRYE